MTEKRIIGDDTPKDLITLNRKKNRIVGGIGVIHSKHTQNVQNESDEIKKNEATEKMKNSKLFNFLRKHKDFINTDQNNENTDEHQIETENNITWDKTIYDQNAKYCFDKCKNTLILFYTFSLLEENRLKFS